MKSVTASKLSKAHPEPSRSPELANGPDISKYGVVRPGTAAESVTGLVEKPVFEEAPPNLASIGRYVLTPDIFEILRGQAPDSGGEIQLADAINAQAAAGQVEGVTLNGQRFDCGFVKGFLQAIMHERGVDISQETDRFWRDRFGPIFANESRRRRFERYSAAPPVHQKLAHFGKIFESQGIKTSNLISSDRQHIFLHFPTNLGQVSVTYTPNTHLIENLGDVD